MNIIQSLYVQEKDVLSFRSRYQSPEIHWLSVAYNSLLIKKYHPNRKLILYANKPVLDLLLDTFRLPYDEHREINCPKEWDGFYSWGKIEALKLQKEPYIHIDHDIFIGKPLSDELFSAPLIAQHEERDSGFYPRVLKHLKNNHVEIPDYLNIFLQDSHIPSYNHGLFGGTDLEFINLYLEKVHSFLDMNKKVFPSMERAYLMCVVFEQWIFYALSKQYEKPVTTYYKEMVYDFNMPVHETILSVIFPKSEYVHLLNFKEDSTCNKMVARNMYKEFPAYYDSILKYCYDNYCCEKVYFFIDNPEITEYIPFTAVEKNIPIMSFHKIANEQDAMGIKKHEMEYYRFCKAHISEFIHYQNFQQSVFDKIKHGNVDICNCSIKHSPYIRIMKGKEDNYIVLSYNFLYDEIETFSIRGEDKIYWDISENGVNVKEVCSILGKDNKEKAVRNFLFFVYKALFHDIIYCNITT